MARKTLHWGSRLGFLQAIVKVGFEATGWSRTLEEAFMIPYEQMSKQRPTK